MLIQAPEVVFLQRAVAHAVLLKSLSLEVVPNISACALMWLGIPRPLECSPRWRVCPKLPLDPTEEEGSECFHAKLALANQSC